MKVEPLFATWIVTDARIGLVVETIEGTGHDGMKITILLVSSSLTGLLTGVLLLTRLTETVVPYVLRVLQQLANVRSRTLAVRKPGSRVSDESQYRHEIRSFRDEQRMTASFS